MEGSKIKQCLTNRILLGFTYDKRKLAMQNDRSDHRAGGGLDRNKLRYQAHLHRVTVLAEPVLGATASDSTLSDTPKADCRLPRLEYAKTT